MTIINGTKHAHEAVDRLKEEKRPTKFLGAILVGEDAASASFLKVKAKVAAELGVGFRLMHFSLESKFERVEKLVRSFAQDDACGGIIIQLPLPSHIEKERVTALLNMLPAGKDVDVLGAESLKRFREREWLVLPPAAGVVVKILVQQYATLGELFEKRIAVVGVGRLIGEPIITLFEGKTESFGKFRRGSDLTALKDFDVVILGTGVPGLAQPRMFREGAGVIDFGYGKKNEKLMGDLDTTNADSLKHLAFYTPTPGGTGPMLVAQLFENFYTLNKKIPSE